MKMTIAQLRDLQAAGTIRGFTQPAKEKGHPAAGGRIVAKHFAKKSKEKDWIASNLLMWCNQRCLTLEEEYRFHPDRKWRFDWCMPALKVAVEYEGLMSDKSRHTTKKGFTGDTEKYNAAAGLGWKVLRFTALNYKTLFQQLNQFI